MGDASSHSRQPSLEIKTFDTNQLKIGNSMKVFHENQNFECKLLLKLKSQIPLCLEDLVATEFDSFGSPKLTIKKNEGVLEEYRNKLFEFSIGFTFIAIIKLDREYPRRCGRRTPKSFWEGYMVSDVLPINRLQVEDLLQQYAVDNNIQYITTLSNLTPAFGPKQTTEVSNICEYERQISDEEYNSDSINPKELSVEFLWRELLKERELRKKQDTQIEQMRAEITQLSSQFETKNEELKQLVQTKSEYIRKILKRNRSPYLNGQK
ncbi:hypothetical protein DASB73_007890 [Starmerella bacillaris]|uniref:Uncharacterized protein n=1 Tax=Starmerella bacillaris TaxID=1247836 RepID=A0AAV5RE33_STABA|nr:hypothetical protein DASB73_007890 [Starmerella bacillaris]